MPKQKRAFSYIRFSRAHQEEGDSLRRQTADTARYCEKHGFILDDSLDLQDKGVSAFKGRNAKQGALSRFLDACERGVVPPGSALIVENLDRLSRQKPRRTQTLIAQLLDDYKIEVHLTMVGKVLLPERDDGMEAMYVVALATSANEESERKSRRLKEVFAEKRKQAETGISTVVHPVLPWWLEPGPEGERFICPPERRAVVEVVYELAAKGWSTSQIARHLHNKGTPTWRIETHKKNERYGQQRRWDSSYLIKLLKTDAVQGHLSPQAKRGRAHTIHNYYPRIISDELAAEARAAQGRLVRGGRGRIADPDAMRPINVLRNLLRYNNRWVRFGCAANRRLDSEGRKTYYGFYECIDQEAQILTGKGKLVYYTSARQIEPILFAALAELKPDDLRPAVADTKPKRSLSLKAEIAKLEAKAQNLLIAIESGSISVANRLKQVEDETAKLRHELARAVTQESIPADAVNEAELDQIRELQAELNDNPSRERIAAALRRIVSRIDVGRSLRDLPIESVDRHQIMSRMVNRGIETVADPTTTERGRKPIWLYVSFVGGGHRLIGRDTEFVHPNTILSIRIGPATPEVIARMEKAQKAVAKLKI